MLMIKTERITIAGFGGQGIMTLGQIIAHTAAKMDLNSLWFPSYGPETRGGTANCAVIVSKMQINSPVFSKANTLIAFNKPSLEKFYQKVENEGRILYNSSLIDTTLCLKGPSVYGIPINSMANDLGNIRVANMIMLGAYLQLVPIFNDDIIKEVLQEYLGKKRQDLLDINLLAIKQGKEFIKEGS